MNKTLTRGLLSELAFAQRCIELGLEVVQPMGVERYDLGVIVAGVFQRVQVKTGRMARGCVEFNTKSNAEGVGRPVDYEGVVDAIGVYAPHLRQSYWVPIGDCQRSVGRLRVEPTRNNVAKGVRWADEYRLDRFVAQVAAARPTTLARLDAAAG